MRTSSLRKKKNENETKLEGGRGKEKGSKGRNENVPEIDSVVNIETEPILKTKVERSERTAEETQNNNAPMLTFVALIAVITKERKSKRFGSSVSTRRGEQQTDQSQTTVDPLYSQLP
jgi:hypothetical protein